MIEVKFKVPIKARAQVAAYEDSDIDDILQAIKDEIRMRDIEDVEKNDIEIEYDSIEEVTDY